MYRHATGWRVLAVFLLSGPVPAAEQTTLFGYYLNTMGSSSMEPNVSKGDRVWSDPDYYKRHALARGDVVAFRSSSTNQRLWIARVIGLPGEKVAVRSGMVYVGGKGLRENYVQTANNEKSRTFKDVEVQLTQGEAFLMGDNRDASYDCRFTGAINVSGIEAKVVGIYWSTAPGRIGKLDEPGYP